MSVITRFLVSSDFSNTPAPVLERARVLAEAVGAQERAVDPVAAGTA